MILKPVLRGAAAAGAVLAASAVVVVAVSFALYALFKTLFVAQGELAPAIAAALVALIVALAAGVGAALALRKTGPKPKPKVDAPPRSMMERVLEVAKERPIVAAAGALGAGLIALRNPALIATVLGAFAAPPPPRR